MSTLRKAAQAIRHAPGISSAEWLWSGLRGPYQQLLNWRGRGVPIRLTADCTVWMPPEYTGSSWESYEQESVQAACSWAGCHPDGVVLDVGSAIGFYSLIALFSAPGIQAIAFDPDIRSLKATRRMCACATGRRLSVIHGFVAEKNSSGDTFISACAQTELRLEESGVTGDPGTNEYICLGGDADPAIPVHSLDGLFTGDILSGKRILLKCDVEGAELLVLEGARRLLRDAEVDLLLSVHPPALPAYGHSEAQIRAFLARAGYSIEVICRDHEEHWWCEKSLVRFDSPED